MTARGGMYGDLHGDGTPVATPQPEAREGAWQLVPKELTREMLRAAFRALLDSQKPTPRERNEDAWRAMLAAAPPAPQKAEVPTEPWTDSAYHAATPAERVIADWGEEVLKRGNFSSWHIGELLAGLRDLPLTTRHGEATPPAPGWNEAVEEIQRVIVQSVIAEISGFSTMEPEEGETWASWYVAAFDLLPARVRQRVAEDLAALSRPSGDAVTVEGLDQQQFGKVLHKRPTGESPPLSPGERERDLLAELGKHPTWELSHGAIDDDDPEGGPQGWRVHDRFGNINDMEWKLIGSGETPAEAIRAVLSQKEEAGG